ncbi:MAG: biotin transporter BioY [Caldimicrobium sp.]
MKIFEDIWGMKKVYVEKILFAFSFALLLGLLSQIRIPLPFTPVPLTLQTLGVLIIGYYLGSKLGALTIMLYLLLGASGIPFFSGVKGGLLVLSGPTGGYLFGFIAGAYLVGKAKELGYLTKLRNVFFIGLSAHFLIYFFGTLWFISGFHLMGWRETLKEILTLTVFPFVIPDLFKTLLFVGFVASDNKLRGAIKK